MAKKSVRKAAKKSPAKKSQKKPVKKVAKKAVKKAVKKAIKKKVAVKKKVAAKKKVVKKAVAKKAVAKKAVAKKIAKKPSRSKPTPPPRNHDIKIIGIKGSGPDLIISPEETIAKPGDTITWIIEPGSGVATIQDISPSDGKTPPLFSPRPTPLPTSTRCKAGVNGAIKPPSTREYSITYTTVFQPTVPVKVVFDPKIQVNG